MRWWNAYWFRPAPYIDLAMVRLFAVACQLWLLLLWQGFSPARMEELWALPDPLYDPITLLRLFLLPWGLEYRPSPQFMAIVYYITVVSGLMAFVGFRTRLSLLVFMLGSAFMVAYIYPHGDFHHTDAPLIIGLGILALSPAGRVLSVDQLIRRRRGNNDNAEEVLTARVRWPVGLFASSNGCSC
ncbi:MAG: Vitamin K-dependent gamma-carboxylase [Geminicoccaceae bacterium]|nr:Vitamin K-dependent gamma-carboxylase [Geminicoccaceae bacterium]